MLSGSFPFDDDRLFDQIEHAEYSLSGSEWQTVSPSAKHFIKSLMNLDIQQRLDIYAALSHPWIEEYKCHHPSTHCNSSTTSSLDIPVQPTVRESSLPPLPIPSSQATLAGNGSGMNAVDRNVSGESIPDTKFPDTRETANRLVVEELKALRQNSAVELYDSENTKPVIFWSNKAALVKLASTRYKSTGGHKSTPNSGSCATTSPLEVNRKDKTNTTPQYSEEHKSCVLNKRSTMSLNREPVDCNDIESGQMKESGKRKRKRKSASREMDGKALLDDDIDLFSEDDDQPCREIDQAKSGLKIRKTKSAKSQKKQVDVSKKDKAFNDPAPNIGASSMSKLEIGAPSRPVARHLTSANGVHKRTGVINKNSAGIKKIDSYFPKRVMRAPVSSIEEAFNELTKVT